MTEVRPNEGPPPDWERVEGDVVCPLCEYNLRGLADPRCPECGHPFEWGEILDPARRLHPYLFEHHPERRGWSFRKTLVGGLRPGRFWRSLHPSQPSHPRRLVLYWLSVVAIFLAGLVVPIAIFTVADAWRLIAMNRAIRPSLAASANQLANVNPQAHAALLAQHGSVQGYLDDTAPVRIGLPLLRQVGERVLGSLVRLWSVGAVLLALLMWPWVVWPGFLLFRISMRRARIRRAHFLRCVIYSVDGMAWVGLALTGVTIVAFVAVGFNVVMAAITVALLGVVAIAASLIFSVYRLTMAVRLYLRFDHAFGTVVASHVVMMLSLANLMLIIYLLTNSRTLYRLLAPWL